MTACRCGRSRPCAASGASVAILGDGDLSPMAWLAFLTSLLLGLVAIGTGAVLALDHRTRHSAS